MAEVRPPLAELLAYMDESRARLLETVGAVNPSFAAIRPTSGSWSAAEIVAHLAKVEHGVARLIERSVQWARSHDVGPARSNESVLGGLDTFALRTGERKLTAPEFVTPDSDVPLEKSVESLLESRRRLREALVGADDLDLTAVKRPHHLMGELDMYQWALFVAHHEERHRNQVERTMQEVTGRAAECAPIV